MHKLTIMCATDDALHLCQSIFNDANIFKTGAARIYFVESNIKEEDVKQHQQTIPSGPRALRLGNVQAMVLRIIADHPGLCTRRLLELKELVGNKKLEKQLKNVVYRIKMGGLIRRHEKDGTGGLYITGKGKQWLLDHDRMQSEGRQSHSEGQEKKLAIRSRPPHPEGLSAKEAALAFMRTKGDEGVHFAVIQKYLEQWFAPGTVGGATMILRKTGKAASSDGIWRALSPASNGHASA